MSATTLNRRRTKAFAEKQAAKERRQKYFVAAAVLVLVVVVAIELPGIMSHGGSSPGDPDRRRPRAGGRSAGRPGSQRRGASGGATPSAGTIRSPARLGRAPARTRSALCRTRRVCMTRLRRRDPRGVDRPGRADRPRRCRSAASGQDRPRHARCRRVAVKGWIVILASIPTAGGQSAATSFADVGTRRGPGQPFPCSTRRTVGRFGVVSGSSTPGPYGSLTSVNAACRRRSHVRLHECLHPRARSSTRRSPRPSPRRRSSEESWPSSHTTQSTRRAC